MTPVLVQHVVVAIATLVAAVPSTRVVIERDLTTTPVGAVVGVSDQGIEFEDHTGEIRSLVTPGVLALTTSSSPGTLPASGEGWIDLVDGQRLVGRPARFASEGEMIAWRHRDFGVVSLELEDITRIVPPGAEVTVPEPATANDVVYLRNGDQLSGFLLSVNENIVLELDDGTVSVTPADRVRTVLVANPGRDPEGMYVWMDDGSVLALGAMMNLTGERVQAELRTGANAVLRTQDLRAVVFEAQGLVPLARVPMEMTATPEERRWTTPAVPDPAPSAARRPLLFAADIAIPGPMSLRWSLPPGARRLSTIAELTGEAFPWGDCEIVLRDGAGEIFRARLWREEPEVRINVPVEGSHLDLVIEPGPDGAVGDAVRLRAPLLRVSADRDRG